MRIIAGEWRGRKLTAPKGDATRPTGDRTRETLFSMLTSRLGSFEDLRVADLFAGSGALGIEALSRGAAHCLFVEQDRDALDAIRANIATFDARGRSTVEAGSVMGLRAAKEPLDLILLDPPYHTGAGEVALDRLLRLGWIGEATWIALETAFDEEPAIKGLAIETSRKVGKARLHIMQRAD
ncbi:16S rRNA (guanine(966)-N(2))-methyltransferase RsmD [Erythrobacter sp. SCSIO 43205]|uniref:16S rRNA (guanine(966)-N(2))-methyltransferase RsmD n=1 Tax=Erythrobacter sp. SCSIO 43205 TaxID=2779361 RepID=UPI001CA9AAD0|nr:16S rRNA (guanine(966)-N(2))-methyltransferase RsmD [Erythrobacter sp. SCSIO 43205]UAB77403.1 16S rRNA (guanine(966)-N(2))-methyltransferase RsmD [Erythrobacter sp. SCSIO 43205]